MATTAANKAAILLCVSEDHAPPLTMVELHEAERAAEGATVKSPVAAGMSRAAASREGAAQ